MADISESLVASLAETLDAAGAPCILWGQFLLNVHGIPSTIGVCIPLHGTTLDIG